MMGKRSRKKKSKVGKKTLVERARERGISVTALKQQIQNEKAAKEEQLAKHALAPKSAGWNPRAGAKQKHRPERHDE